MNLALLKNWLTVLLGLSGVGSSGGSAREAAEGGTDLAQQGDEDLVDWP
jgi:hypothetical protein